MPIVPKDVRADAEAQMSAGYRCAEATLLALARAQGIESDLVPKVATTLCSGMARTCGQCGALSGALLGLALAGGRNDPRAPVDAVYAASQRVISSFQAEFGGRDCVALLGFDMTTPEGGAIFRERKLIERCREFVGRAAELAAESIASA